MNLTPHFTLAEMVFSDTALRLGLDNTPSPEILTELQRTAQMLEHIRSILGGVPIRVTSGYRCSALNRQIGGAWNSAHLYGCAADIQVPDYGPPLKVARELANYAEMLDFDQLIHEFGGWTHIGRPPPNAIGEPRRMLLTIDGSGTREGLA
jgi:zinc D-Ala-D-Ala carboxypeptidase